MLILYFPAGATDNNLRIILLIESAILLFPNDSVSNRMEPESGSLMLNGTLRELVSGNLRLGLLGGPSPNKLGSNSSEPNVAQCGKVSGGAQELSQAFSHVGNSSLVASFSSLSHLTKV